MRGSARGGDPNVGAVPDLIGNRSYLCNVAGQAERRRKG